VRIHLDHDAVEIRLTLGEKALGLLRSIRVPLADVSDIQVLENPMRAVMGSGLKIGLRLPWVYYLARSIKLDQLWIVRRGTPAVSFAVRNQGALRRVTVSTRDAQGLAAQLRAGSPY
jgi:hypothetical protein